MKNCAEIALKSPAILGLVIFYLTFFTTFKFVISQNVNNSCVSQLASYTDHQKIVYSCAQLRSIGSTSCVFLHPDTSAKCAKLKILCTDSEIRQKKGVHVLVDSVRTETPCSDLNTVCSTPTKTHKKTRRTSRRGSRKQRKIQVCLHKPNFDPVSNNRNINKPTSNNRNINKQNHVVIDCRNIFQETSVGFRIACLNTQSCRNKTNSIVDLIQELNIDLLCITESWLREVGDENIQLALAPPDYSVKSFPRIGRSGGGGGCSVYLPL